MPHLSLSHQSTSSIAIHHHHINHFQTQQVLMNSPDRQASDEPELQLPDFDVMVRSYQAIANELPKFHNIPAFDVGAAILTEMRAMRGEMNEMREEMNEKIDRFDGRFKAMYVALPSSHN
jgi:hypothetical protein